MTSGGAGHTAAMHHLGFELPDRGGFGALWAPAETGGGAGHRAAETAVRHPVATSAGAGSPAVRAAIAAFCARGLPEPPEGVAA